MPKYTIFAGFSGHEKRLTKKELNRVFDSPRFSKSHKKKYGVE